MAECCQRGPQCITNIDGKMKVSVIIPTYKPGDYLRECLIALDNQTLDHSLFEVLLVLNGSKEPYMTQIETLTKGHPNLICRLIYSEMNGVSLARNIALDEARGEYLCFIDDDDLVTSNYLEELLAVVAHDTVALSNVCAFDDGDKTQRPIYISRDFKEGKKDVPFIAARRYFYVCWGKLIHSDIVKNRRFDVSLKNGEDCQFMLQISDCVEKVNFTGSNVKYMYRQRSNSAFYVNNSAWYHFSNMLIRFYKATKVYIARPMSYSFRFYVTFMLATFMGGIRQMLHIKQ